MIFRKTIIHNNSYNFFSAFFDQFYDLINHGIKTYQDAIFGYNEKATAGAFSAIFWKNDYYVVEDYSAIIKKKFRKTNQIYGRADLWLQKNSSYLIEVKQFWPNLYLNQRIQENLSKSLREARKQVVKYDEPPDKKLGLVFMTPKIAKGKLGKKTEILKDHINELNNLKLNYDFLSYYYDDNLFYNYDGHLLPGITIIGKQPKS